MTTDSIIIIPADAAGFVYLWPGMHFPNADEFKKQFGNVPYQPVVERSELPIAIAWVDPDTAVDLDQLNARHFSSAVNHALEGKILDLPTVAALLLASRKKLIKTQFKIMYQDEHCVIIHKPCGLLVHRSDKSDDRECVLQLLRDQLGTFVHPAHRIDRQTSGLLLFALSKEANGVFSQLFEERRVIKHYLALVRGWTDDEGVIERPLKQGRQEIKRDSTTEYTTLARYELPYPVRPYDTARCSLVRINLLTGRTHQIRRHMCSISHPLIGDTNYGDGYHNRLYRDKFNFHRIFLLSERLCFTHPFTGELIDLKAEPDTSLQNLLDKLETYV
jgi:tRNA pseudouridine65 synthase